MKRTRTIAILAAFAALAWACGPKTVALDEAGLEAKARALHARILSVDTHSDTAMRMATRQVFQALFGRGYRVVDFLKTEPGGPANHYVLARQVPPVR